MPSTLIEVRREYTPEQEIAIIDAVQAALIEAFCIPESDKHISLIAHLPHRFALPTEQQNPERYTRVSVTAFSGRSLDAKRKLYQCVGQNLEKLDILRHCVTIIVHEVPQENWGIRGGQAACDVDLGFKVNV